MAKDNYSARAYNFLVKSGYIDPQEINFNSFNSQMSNPDFSRTVYSNFQDAKQKGKIGTLKPFEEFVAEFQAPSTPTTPPPTQATPSAQAGGAPTPTPTPKPSAQMFPWSDELKGLLDKQEGAPQQAPEATPTELPKMQDGTQMPTGGGLGQGQFEITDTTQQQQAPALPPVQQVQAQTTATGSSGVPSGVEAQTGIPYMDALANAVQRGYNRGEIADYITAMGKTPDGTELKKIAEITKANDKLATSEYMKQFSEDPSISTTILSLPEIAIESIASLYRHGLARMGAGAAAGAGVGSVVPGVGTAIGAGTGALAGMSVAGLGVEVSSTILDSFRELGVDITNEKALEVAFKNPQIMGYAKNMAYSRGIPIAVFDAVSMGVAGKILGKPASTVARRIGQVVGEATVQGSLGAAGEASAQAISGQEFKPYEILAEGLAEIPGSVPEVGIAMIGKRKASGADTKLDVNKLAVDNPDMPANVVSEIIDVSVGTGELSGQQADEIKADFAKAQEINATIPEDIKEQGSRITAIGIIEERNNLTAKLETVDEAFKPQIQEKIKALNQQLQELATIGTTPEAQTFFDTNEASPTNPITTMPTGVEVIFDKIADDIDVHPESLHRAYQWTNQSITDVVGNKDLSDAEKGATLNILNGMLMDIDRANTLGQERQIQAQEAEMPKQLPKGQVSNKPLKTNVNKVLDVKNKTTQAEPIITESVTETTEATPTTTTAEVATKSTTEAVTETPTGTTAEVEAVIERANNAIVPEGEGTWRKAFNESKDFSQKTQILEVLADSQASTENELRDIYEAAKIVEPNANRVNVALARNPNTPQDVFDNLIESKELEKTLSDAGIDELIQRRKESQSSTATEQTTEAETVTTTQDAVQKQTAGQVPVQSGTTSSQEVAKGEPQAEPKGTADKGQAEATATQEEVVLTPALADVESTAKATDEEVAKNIQTAKANGGFTPITDNPPDLRTPIESDKLYNNGFSVYRAKDRKGNTWVVAMAGYDQFRGRTGYTMAMIKDDGNLPANIEDTLILKAAEDWMNSPEFMKDDKGTQASKMNADRVKPMIEAKVNEIKQKQESNKKTPDKNESKANQEKPLLEGVRDGGTEGKAGQESAQLRPEEAGKPQATKEGEVTQPTPEAKPKSAMEQAREARRQAQAKAKAPTQAQRVKAREAYFKPGAIVESYGGGRDRVIEYTQDPNDATKWSVTVQQVDAKGNPVGEPRTHKTEPSDKEYKRAGVEVVAEKTTTPPTPKEVKENSEQVYNDAQSTFVFPFGLNPKFKFDVRLPENVQRFFKKYFRPRGLWTPELFKGKRSNEGRIASQAERVKFKIRDLQDAISKSYPKGVKESDVKRMNEFLQGNAIELPPALYKPLEAMRDDIDRLSRIMIEEGIIDQKLVPVFNANMGMYTTRTYDIHNDPESWISYIKNTPEGEQLRNKAVNLLRQEYEAKADRADKLADKSEARAVSFSNQAQKTQDPDKILELEYYADRAIQRADKLRAQAEALRQGDFDAKIDAFLFDESQPLGIVKKGKYGSKDLGILQKRKDIPEAIRQLMGEVQDPITNYTMSVAKMATLISNNKFLNDAKVQGLKDGTFTTEAKGKNIVQIASESTDSMNPLNGLYTTEEIAQAFDEYQKIVESPDYIKLMLRLNGMIKLGKTVLSPTTHVRNFGSNILIEIGNGSFSLKGLKEAGVSQYEQIFGLKTSDRKEKVREYVEELIELGVLGSGANYGDMLAYYDDIRSSGKYDYQKVIEPKIKSGLKSGMGAIKNLYRAEDDFFKVHAFEDERATLKKAYGNTKTDRQIKELAADKVLKTRINYDMAPKIVDAIRKVPFMGTFPTFPAEVVRISVNIPTVAVQEMRSGNKVLQKKGAQRMAGFMVALTLPSALNSLSKYLLDIDDEEEEARKLFIAPWSQNSTLVWLDKDRYVDTGYSDAFNTIKTPVVAALKGADLTAGVVAGIMDFVDPYITGEIGYKMLKEIADNRDEYDSPVYNENADAGTKAAQIFGFAMKKAEPGFVSQARRLYKGETGELAEKGQKYSTKDELLNLTLGQKVVTVDWDNAVLFKLKANAEDIKDSNSFYNKANKQLPEKDKKGRVQEAEATNLAVERSVEQLREYYNATKAMGFSTAKTVRLMKEANIPKDIIIAVATNQPYKNFLIVTKSGTVIDRNTQRLLGQ